jgi:hypothetical protein
MISCPHKQISDIEGMENYKFYFVTINGDIYSHKYQKIRKLKPNWSNGNKSYQVVQLSNGKGNRRSFYIHRIVANAFLPNPTTHGVLSTLIKMFVIMLYQT